MVQQSIKVYARIRNCCIKKAEQYEVLQKSKAYEDLVFLNNINVPSVHHGFRKVYFIKKRRKTPRIRVQKLLLSYELLFHKVFDSDITQPDVFETVAKPVICSVIEGFNGTIFAYGQTGSGKTFSINGSSKNYSDRGIIPRSIQYVFEHYSNMPEKPTVYISYMEIYNEVGYDLLSNKQPKIAKSLEELPRVFLLEDKKGDAHIRNLSVFPVTTEEEAMRLLFMGDTNRTIAETPYNEYSSRSHCIFTLYITHRDTNSKILRSSKLHLVDLAGSERVYKTNCTGMILHEAKCINLSLHFLQQVILALSESKRSHIPYRNSMLTHLLKDSLNGNCITTMLATLSIDKENLQETLSTCRFAQRVSLISTDPIINEITDPQQEIDMLKARIQDLEAQLSRSTEFSSTTNLSVQQKESCQFEVESFINSDKKLVMVESDLTQIQFCFYLLKKELVRNKNELRNVDNVMTKKNSEIITLNEEIDKKNKEIENLKNIIFKRPEHPVPVNTPMDSYVSCSSFINQKSKENNSFSNISEQNAYEEITGDLTFYKSTLQNKLNMAKLYADTIEECKVKITNIKNKLADRYTTAKEKKDLIKTLEEQQLLYKQVLQEMKQLQNETNHLEAGLKQAEFRAAHKFKSWLENNDPAGKLSNYPLNEHVDKIYLHLTPPDEMEKMVHKQINQIPKLETSPLDNQKVIASTTIKSMSENKIDKLFETIISPRKSDYVSKYSWKLPEDYTKQFSRKTSVDSNLNGFTSKVNRFDNNNKDDFKSIFKKPDQEINIKRDSQENGLRSVSRSRIVDTVAEADNINVTKYSPSTFTKVNSTLDVTNAIKSSPGRYNEESVSSTTTSFKSFTKNSLMESTTDVDNNYFGWENKFKDIHDQNLVNSVKESENGFSQTIKEDEEQWFCQNFKEIETDNSTVFESCESGQLLKGLESDRIESENACADSFKDSETSILDACEYFKDSDTLEFREFMKTVTLSGVSEIDEEIVNFYRSKFC